MTRKRPENSPENAAKPESTAKNVYRASEKKAAKIAPCSVL